MVNINPSNLRIQTYMNWPVALLHMVRSEDVGVSGKLVEKAILETKQWRRSHNCGLREYAAYNCLTSGLRMMR